MSESESESKLEPFKAFRNCDRTSEKKYQKFRKMPIILECEKRLDEVSDEQAVLISKKFVDGKNDKGDKSDKGDKNNTSSIDKSNSNSKWTAEDEKAFDRLEAESDRLESIIFLEYALFEL